MLRFLALALFALAALAGASEFSSAFTDALQLSGPTDPTGGGG